MTVCVCVVCRPGLVTVVEIGLTLIYHIYTDMGPINLNLEYGL